MDKLSGRSSQLGMRNPPSFVRTPSRRYQRRIVEGASEGKPLLPLSLKTLSSIIFILLLSEYFENAFLCERQIKHRVICNAPSNFFAYSLVLLVKINGIFVSNVYVLDSKIEEKLSTKENAPPDDTKNIYSAPSNNS